MEKSELKVASSEPENILFPIQDSARLPVPLPRFFEAKLLTFFKGTSTRRRVFYLLQSVVRHHSLRTANAMAFDFFLAFIPMLGLAGWFLAHWLEQSSSIASATGVLINLTPSQLHDLLEKQFKGLTATSLAPFAVLLGWWLSSSAFYTQMNVFEESFECKPRSWLHGRAISLGFALLGLLTLSVAGFASLIWTVLRLPTAALTEVSDTGWIAELLQFMVIPVALVGAMAFLAFIYRYSIRRPQYQRRVWPGAFFAIVVGTLASAILGYYVANIARYALFYGSLAVIVVLHLWLWLWCTAIILGAEINIALEDLKDSQALAKE